VTRATARIAAAALLLSGVATAGQPAHAATRLSRPAEQAISALQQLDRQFLNVKEGLYDVTGGQHEPQAALWPTSQALQGSIEVAQITGAPADLARVQRIIGSLHHYLAYNGVYHARVIPSLRYFDDNNWVALDLIDASQLLHDASLLTIAERIFKWDVSGWDSAKGGGIIWADGHSDRPTVSTAPAITIGIRLAAITHDSYYSTWAMRFYAWMNSVMRAPSGLYYDHIDPQGRIDRDTVSYNQGVMIDANLALAAYTHQAQYISQARAIAAATARAFPRPWRNRGNYAAFDALYFESLAHLNAVAPGAASMAPVQSYVNWEWPVASSTRANRSEDAMLEQTAFVIAAAAVSGHYL
jgi:hypothetical protein